MIHFLIKELINKFEGEFNSLAKNTEKDNTFSVPIDKGIRKIDKNGEKI